MIIVRFHCEIGLIFIFHYSLTHGCFIKSKSSDNTAVPLTQTLKMCSFKYQICPNVFSVFLFSISFLKLNNSLNLLLHASKLLSKSMYIVQLV